MSHPDVLFVSYQDTLKLLSVEAAMKVCEDVYRMHARGSVVLSKPPSFKLDIGEGFNNHWHVKGTLLKDIPVTGVRMYNYYDDGKRNTVGALDCTRYIVLSDPHTGHALAIVDEHLVYGLRSSAAAVIPCKWLGPVAPKVLGLVGIGAMGTNTMRCLLTQYRFEKILVTSRRPETREAFAAAWSKTLGIPVIAKERIEDVVAKAKALRARYSNNPLIHADFIKLFADGVLEGNPFAVPPTLPNAAALKPFLQPIFAVDAKGHATVSGYVDTASATCADVRAHPAKYAAAADIDKFIKAHGHHPAQCAISAGELQHSREIILEYVKRMHLAGFNVHIHAISDRSVRTAVDAIEAARQADGISTTRDGLAHLQLVNPSDVARIGRDHLYLAFTYAWINTDPDYDLTVIPFFQKVTGNSYAALHAPNSYYESNTYPVKALENAGSLLVAGSDAPVETRDPRPFVNMSRAVTRSTPDSPALNPQQSIPLRDAIDAYTINGARMLNLQNEAGSLEVGKSADFVLLDRDILALADSGHPEGVADTKVLATWFRGEKVYGAASR